ncbi:MAG: helix-hairpin-helix domain-containing protein [Bacteroidota bacterium]
MIVSCATWEFPKENRKEYPREKKIDSVKRFPQKRKVFPRRKFQLKKFDLNLADTTQLKTIYGIGPVIAKRIITYRTNLGGFILKDQLYENMGIRIPRWSSAWLIKSVIAPDFTPNKLAINRCSEQELAHHPYVRTKLARAIVNYRFQHGNFASIDDLKKIEIMEEKILLRIKPYITLD